MPSRFPNPLAIAADCIAWSDYLDVELLIDAYAHGIFPWPMDDGDAIPWFCPQERAVLFLAEVHIPQSLQKWLRQNRSLYLVTFDQNFSAVIRNCQAAPRKGQDGTWITPAMQLQYEELHHRGHAHSVEVYDSEKNLVAGIYGVDAGGIFCAESMFTKNTNASKLGLLHLCAHLKEKGSPFLDIQTMTPHLHMLGARMIARPDFLRRLQIHQARALRLF